MDICEKEQVWPEVDSERSEDQLDTVSGGFSQASIERIPEQRKSIKETQIQKETFESFLQERFFKQ